MTAKEREAFEVGRIIERVKSETPMAYSPEQAAQMLGVGETTVYRELRAGNLKGRRVGKRWIIPHSSLMTYLNEETPSGAKC